MCKQMLCTMVLLLAAVPASYGVVVGDFETGFDGWSSPDGTLSQSTTGATTGTKSLQVDTLGEWKSVAKLDAKPYIAILGVEGAVISADITVSNQGESWMDGQIIINGQNNGTNYKIGWREIPTQSLVRDGAPHTYKWRVDAALAADIALADSSIGWFEVFIVINNNVPAANPVKVNIDNVQINEPVKNRSIGNFETGMDSWFLNWSDSTLTQSTTGATVGSKALQIENAAGGWKAGAFYDARPRLYRTMLGSPGAIVMMDVTAFAADLNGTWSNIEMVLDCQNTNTQGANNNLGWISMGTRNVARDGLPHTLIWEPTAAQIAKIALADGNIEWFNLLFASNTDSSTTKYYVDNIRIGAVFPAIVLSDAEWLSGGVHAQVTSVTNIPGDPGLLLQVNKTGSGGIDAISKYFGGADLSSRGKYFEVELENPGTAGYNINAFAMCGSGWNWASDWYWLGAGRSVVYCVPLANVDNPTNPASVVQSIGFQLHADAGQYMIKIKGGAVDLSPSDPTPADQSIVGVILSGNRLSWTNHSYADPIAGSNVVSELFISSDVNDVFTTPGVTRIPGLTNFGVVTLMVDKHYRWGVQASEPDGKGGFIVYQSPIWSFDSIQRHPSTRYEAENSTIRSGTAAAPLVNTSPEIRNVGAASGGKIVWSNWSGDDRGSFIFDVMAPAAGSYNLTIHYAIDGTDDRGEKIQVNEAVGGDTMFPATQGQYADLVVPVTLKKGLNTLGIVTSWGGTSFDYFELNMDDLTATLPSPIVNEVVLVGSNKLSWRKHSLFDPQNASDTLCTVYLGTTEPNASLPHYGYTAIATDITASSIPVALEWNKNYFWVVDSTAAVDANSVVFPGYLWKFTTVDPKPVITLDAAKTVRRTVPVVFKPTVTDKGIPGLSYAWSLTSGPEGVVIGDICANPTALNPSFAFTKVGAHTLTLSVTDGSANVSTASINVDVIEYYRALRLEAEDGTIIPGDPGPLLRTDDNASGNRLVWSNWTGNNRSSFIVDVNLPNLAGTYDMVIHYRVDGTGARGDRIQVNGYPSSPGDTMFPGTNGVYDDYVVKNVTLVNGANQIKITTSWGGMSYDYFEFPAIKAPLAAYEPNPETFTFVPSTLTNLSWRVDPNSINSVINSVVYIGTAKPDFTKPNYGMTKIVGNTGTTASVSGLVKDTTYYWLVKYTDSDQASPTFPSATWQFTTVNPCEFFPLVGDLNQDCTVNVDDLRILAAAWMAPQNGYLLDQFADMAAHWLMCMDPVTGVPGQCGM